MNFSSENIIVGFLSIKLIFLSRIINWLFCKSFKYEQEVYIISELFAFSLSVKGKSLIIMASREG